MSRRSRLVRLLWRAYWLLLLVMAIVVGCWLITIAVPAG